MLSPKVLVDFLLQNNISFFSGVPDSLLKDFCAYVDDEFPQSRHIIAATRTIRVTTLIVRVSPRLPKSFSVPAKNAGPVCPITPLSWADLVDCDSASSAMLVQTNSNPVAVRGKTALRRVLHRLIPAIEK